MKGLTLQQGTGRQHRLRPGPWRSRPRGAAGTRGRKDGRGAVLARGGRRARGAVGTSHVEVGPRRVRPAREPLSALKDPPPACPLCQGLGVSVLWARRAASLEVPF